MIDYNEFIKKYQNFFEKYMRSLFRANKKRNKVPGFRLNMSDRTYYDPNENIISVGIGTAKEFGIETEEELIAALYYLIGHEIQHTISTTERGWAYSLNKSREVVYKNIASYINRDYKKPIYKFVKEEDYNNFNKFIEDEGIYIDATLINQCCHYITNSFEDGRIERIRATKNPAFLSYMVNHRGKYWDTHPLNIEDINNPKISEAEKELSLLLNEIWNVSTMRIYMKDTFIMNELFHLGLTEKVYPLLPIIKKGVNGRNCKEMAQASIELANAISEYIYNAAKKDLSQNPSSFGENNSFGNSLSQGMTSPDPYKTNDREEVTDTGEQEEFSPFGEDVLSDLGSSPFGEDVPSDLGSSNTDNLQQSSNSSQNTTQEESVKAKVEDSMEDMCNKIEQTVRSGYGESKEQNELEHDIDSARDEEAEVKLIDIAKTVTDSFFLDVPKTPNKTTPSEIKTKGNVLKRKLKKILINKQKPNMKEQKSGTVDGLFIHRLAMKDVNIFEKKSTPELFNGCAYFLMDMSGSMSGQKYNAAIKTLSLLEEGFKELLPIKIMGFNSDYNDVDFHLIKDWNNCKKNCSYNFGEVIKADGCNMDGYAIQIAGKELLSMPYEKKLLYIISDGLPAYDDGESHTASVVNALRRSGIEISAIYIGDTSKETYDTITFKKMYKLNCTITDIDNICDDVVRKTKKFITK